MRDLIERLDELRARDPRFTLFGASTHRYRVEPATEREIVAFERTHGARLPDVFHTFLREVTNGGAGPGYGLFALDRDDDDDVAEDLALLAEPFDHDTFFALPPPPEDPFADEEAYEAATLVYWRNMPGTLTLSHFGCALRAYLVITGERAGEVVFDRRTEFAGVHPLGDFISWYRGWLDQSLVSLAS